MIAFVGSVFSPYYALARRRHAQVNPENHCAINLAIYSPGNKRWTMTERSAASISRNQTEFVIGPSNLHWNGDHLRVDFVERAVPFGQRVVGHFKLYPKQLFNFSTHLDDQHKHRWGPLAPAARIEVELESPKIKWQGNAYFDSNEGDEPIAIPFKDWDWSRAQLSGERTAVIYDVRQRNGVERILGLIFTPDGRIEHFEPPPRQALPKTGWRIQRQMRNPKDAQLKILETLEDTPFYARSVLSSELLGERVTSFHETLDVPRLSSWAVQFMLPWRMPRVK